MSIVADVGSVMSKVGISGMDHPIGYFSSYAPAGELEPLDSMTDGGEEKNAGNFSSFNLDLSKCHDESCHWRNPFAEDHDVASLELYTSLLAHGIAKSLGTTTTPPDLSDNPLLLVVPSLLSPSSRARLCDHLFECLPSLPAIYFGKDCTLACYSVGKSSATVVDVGGSGVRVSPVFEGWVQEGKGGRLLGRDGKDGGYGGGVYQDQLWGELLKKKLSEEAVASSAAAAGTSSSSSSSSSSDQTSNNNTKQKQPNIDTTIPRSMQHLPPSTLSSLPSGPNSYRHLAYLSDLRNGKESACKIGEFGYGRPGEASDGSNDLKIPYSLPDGTNVQIGKERYALGEALFGGKDPARKEFDALQKFVTDTVWSCNRDHHVALLSNVVVTGGGSVVEGFAERVRAEVEDIIHVHTPMWRLKVLASGEKERRYGNWLGGSILSSLSGFEENWVSRKEWQEQGGDAVNLKCP